MYDSHFGYKQNIPKKTLGLLTSLSLLFFRFPDEVHNPRLATASGPQMRSISSRGLVRSLLQVPRRGPELQETSFSHFFRSPDEVQNFKGPRSATWSITFKGHCSASFSTQGAFFVLAKFRQKAKFEIRNSKMK
jgi:hypothetical protein